MTHEDEIAALKAEVIALKEQLQPYLDAEEEQRKQEALKTRIEYLVDLLCPSYNSYYQKERPICHPSLSSWWNGASVSDFTVLSDGNVHVDIKSYVGNHEYEFDEVIIPKEWIEMENPKESVEQWCIAETKRQADKRAEYARQETIRKIAALTKQLEDLK